MGTRRNEPGPFGSCDSASTGAGGPRGRRRWAEVRRDEASDRKLISKVGCGQIEETVNTILNIWSFVSEATAEPSKVWRRAGNFSKMVTPGACEELIHRGCRSRDTLCPSSVGQVARPRGERLDPVVGETRLPAPVRILALSFPSRVAWGILSNLSEPEE